MPEDRIPFRSPKKITEEMVNNCMHGNVKDPFEANHVGRIWGEHHDDKEIHKLVMNIAMQQSIQGAYGPLYGLITFCMQCGYDLHAAYGDSGPAAAYVAEEKKLQAEEAEARKKSQPQSDPTHIAPHNKEVN